MSGQMTAPATIISIRPGGNTTDSTSTTEYNGNDVVGDAGNDEGGVGTMSGWENHDGNCN